MRKFGLRALYFSIYLIAFLIVSNSIFLFTIVRTDYDFRKRIESKSFIEPKFDILVLGSSLAQYGVNTEYLVNEGLEAYNLALVGSSVKTGYIQLKEYLNTYNYKPKYVILAVNATLENFDQEGIQPVVEFTMKDQEINFKDIPLSKFRWQGTELFKKAWSKDYRTRRIPYGHLISFSVTKDNSNYSDGILNKQKYTSANWIGEIASLCSRSGIEFIMVEIPGVKETQNLTEVGPHLINFSNGTSADLYNLNSQEFCHFIDSDNHWSGLSHFNGSGATRFTRELMEITPINKLHK